MEQLNLTYLSGSTLNIEERTNVQAALSLLKDQNKVDDIKFWGKINGVQKDYLILATSKPVFFYSVDGGTLFAKLPEPSALDIKKAGKVYKRFTGDPAYLYRQLNEPGESEEEGWREEARLAATVQKIHADAAVAPIGLYEKQGGKLRKNQLFSGLSSQDVLELKNYIHLLNSETLENDQPQGQWRFQQLDGNRYTVLRSLKWPGFNAVHGNDGSFGFFYIGNGQLNEDLGFALS